MHLVGFTIETSDIASHPRRPESSDLMMFRIKICVTRAFTFMAQVTEYCVFVSESNVTCAVQLHRRSTIWQCLMQRFAISAPISVWCPFKGSIPRMHSQAMNQLQYQQVRMSVVFTRDQHCSRYTGLFVSPSGISELDCATTKTDTAERSISIRRESLQVFFCTRGLGVLPGSTARG